MKPKVSSEPTLLPGFTEPFQRFLPVPGPEAFSYINECQFPKILSALRDKLTIGSSRITAHTGRGKHTQGTASQGLGAQRTDIEAHAQTVQGALTSSRVSDCTLLCGLETQGDKFINCANDACEHTAYPFQVCPPLGDMYVLRSQDIKPDKTQTPHCVSKDLPAILVKWKFPKLSQF